MMFYASNLARLWSVANFFFAIVILLPALLKAQTGSTSTAGFIVNSAAMTSVSRHSLSINAAIAAFDSSQYISCELYPSRFGLSELQLNRAMAGAPLSSTLHGAFCLSSFGWQLYRELDIQSSLAYALSGSAAIGLSLHYCTLNITNYASRHQLRADAALTIDVGPRSRFAACVLNINRAAFDPDSQTTSQEFIFGYGMRYSPELSVDADLAITLNRAASVRVAMKYKILEILSIRLAYDTAATAVESDQEIEISESLRVYSMLHLHDILGLSMGGGVQYRW